MLSLAAEIVGLAIVEGQPQHAEPALLVNLHLYEAARPRARIRGRGDELAEWCDPRREHVAVPGFELELRAETLQLQHQGVTIDPQCRLAEARVDEVAGERRERGKRPRVRRLH